MPIYRHIVYLHKSCQMLNLKCMHALVRIAVNPSVQMLFVVCKFYYSGRCKLYSYSVQPICLQFWVSSSICTCSSLVGLYEPLLFCGRTPCPVQCISCHLCLLSKLIGLNAAGSCNMQHKSSQSIPAIGLYYFTSATMLSADSDN